MGIVEKTQVVPPPGISSVSDSRRPALATVRWHMLSHHRDRSGDGETERCLLTTEQAAQRLSVSRATLYRLMRNGELASVRIGRSRRVTPAALDDFVQRLG